MHLKLYAFFTMIASAALAAPMEATDSGQLSCANATSLLVIFFQLYPFFTIGDTAD